MLNYYYVWHLSELVYLLFDLRKQYLAVCTLNQELDGYVQLVGIRDIWYKG